MQVNSISRAELLAIRSACKNTSNWNDFGYWQGRGSKPNCNANSIKTKTASLTIKWPTMESVENWHSIKDKEARNTGYVINVIIGIISLYTGAGAASLVSSTTLKGAYASAAILAIDTVSDITKGELLAKVPRVKPHPGDSMVIKFSFQTREYAQVGQKSVFVISSKSTHYRADGSVVQGAGTKNTPSTLTFSGDSFPMELAHQIMASRMADRVVSY